MRSLQQCLLDTDPVRLRAIARFWDVELTASRRPAVAAQLAEAMTAPDVARNAWQALRDDQQQAFETVLAAGGELPLKVFARRWGDIRVMGPGRMERERPWQAPVSPAEGLWYRGFIFRAFEQTAEGTYEVVLVPPEIRCLLPLSAPPPPALRIEPVPDPLEVRAEGDAALDDVCTLLAYLQNEEVHPGSDWVLPARHEARLACRLHSPQPDRLALLQHLVRQLGWLRTIDSARLRPDPEPVAAWLQSSPSEQRRALATAWRETKTWNDLCHVPTLRCEDTGAWRNDPLLARRAILHHLTTCLPNTWYGINDFTAAVKQADPDFQRPDGDYAAWYIRDAVTGAYVSGFESWDAVEGALIRYILTGPLAWLSVIDLGTSTRDGQPTAFRLTRAGAALLGLAEPPPEPESVPLTLQDDFSVLAPPGRRYERFQLARFANWVFTGDPFVYRIAPSSMERARRHGISVARVLAFLSRACDAPVPRYIEAALTRWDAREEEASLEQVVLLRLASERLMSQLTASPSMRRLIREKVSPTAALVRQRDWRRLAAALGKMALLPEVVNLEDDGGD